MKNVASLYIPSIQKSLDVSSSALPIIWDGTGKENYGAAVNVGSGHLFVLSDDFYSVIYNNDNEIMFENILIVYIVI